MVVNWAPRYHSFLIAALRSRILKCELILHFFMIPMVFMFGVSRCMNYITDPNNTWISISRFVFVTYGTVGSIIYCKFSDVLLTRSDWISSNGSVVSSNGSWAALEMTRLACAHCSFFFDWWCFSYKIVQKIGQYKKKQMNRKYEENSFIQ